MALTKVTRNLLSTGIDDQSNATAITIDSSENVGIGTSSIFYASAGRKVLELNGTSSALYGLKIGDSAKGYLFTEGNDIYLGAETGLGILLKTNSAQPIKMQTNSTERMRIDSSGHVLVGKTSGTSGNLIEVNGRVSAAAGSNSQPTFNCAGDTNTGINLPESDRIQLITGGTERMRIESNGNLRIGLSNSTPTNNTEAGFLAGSASGYASCFIQIPNNAVNGYGILGFYAGSTLLGNITKTGANSVAYNTSSDYRLKENVDYNFNALERVTQLKPARFNFISEADKTVDGFIAHEVQEIVPEAITGVKDEMQEEEYEVTPAVLDEDGNVVTEAVMGTREVPKYQGIDQSKLVPLLTKAIQEQQTLIEELKTRIETLENA